MCQLPSISLGQVWTGRACVRRRSISLLALVTAPFGFDLYEFGRLGRFRSLREMTGYFVSHFTGFPDLDAYLRGYAITGDRLAGLEIPADVLLADDDPVIPVADVAALAPAAALTVHRSAHGGHCGFMQGYRLQSWLDDFVARAFDT